jgi:hypothetical protein
LSALAFFCGKKLLDNATATEAKIQAQTIRTINGTPFIFIISPPFTHDQDASRLYEIRRVAHVAPDAQFLLFG